MGSSKPEGRGRGVGLWLAWWVAFAASNTLGLVTWLFSSVFLVSSVGVSLGSLGPAALAAPSPRPPLHQSAPRVTRTRDVSHAEKRAARRLTSGKAKKREKM